MELKKPYKTKIGINQNNEVFLSGNENNEIDKPKIIVFEINKFLYPNFFTNGITQDLAKMVEIAENISIIPDTVGDLPNPTCNISGSINGTPPIPNRVVKFPMIPIFNVLILNKFKSIIGRTIFFEYITYTLNKLIPTSNKIKTLIKSVIPSPANSKLNESNTKPKLNKINPKKSNLPVFFL